MEIHEKVKSFNTRSEWGFTHDEIEKLLEDYPEINRDRFNNALRGITCMVIEGEMIIYHCDVEKALRCGVENRNLRHYELD